MSRRPAIIYTKTDEAPALATYSLLPHCPSIQTKHAGIAVETRNISLAGRIMANFPEYLAAINRSAMRSPSWQSGDDPGSEHHKTAEYQRVGSQSKAAIAELQSQGYKLPNYPGAEDRGGKGNQGAL